MGGGGGRVVSCLKGKNELRERKWPRCIQSIWKKTPIKHTEVKHNEKRGGALGCTRKINLFTIHNHAEGGIRDTELLRFRSITSLASTASYWPCTSEQIHSSQLFLQQSRKNIKTSCVPDWLASVLLKWRPNPSTFTGTSTEKLKPTPSLGPWSL